MLKRKCTRYIFLLLLGVLIFCSAFIQPKGNVYASGTEAEEETVASDEVDLLNSEGYYIKNYDINMVVGENNILHITETIDCFFYMEKHGIYRDIPKVNNVVRQDGSKITYIAEVKNIKVEDHNFTKTAGSDSDIRVQIGDEENLVSGDISYVISYDYNLGKDRTNKYDELYFNLIGTSWKVDIQKVTFSVQMPKEFDSKSLGFTNGYKGSTTNDVSYGVNGNIISGETTTILKPYEALTIRLQLPEGYFVGEGNISDIILKLSFIVPAVLFVIVLLMYVAGKNKNRRVRTVEFYPPEGLNSLDVALIYKGKVDNKDVVSLLVLLAHKGYLKIEQLSENKDDLKIVKVKEYNGKNKQEKEFMDCLFDGATDGSVKISDLKKKVGFPSSISKIASAVNSKDNKEQYLDRKLLYIGVFAMIMGIVSILFAGLIMTAITPFMLLIYIFPVVAVLMLKILPKDWTLILFMMFWGGIPLCAIVYMSMGYGMLFFIAHIVGSIEGIAAMLLSGRINFRTQRGGELYAKILGFRHFIVVAEKSKLEALCEEEPTYFYNILPYAYVLGVSKVWIKKFENIAVNKPEWYETTSDEPFSIAVCNNIMSSANKVSVSRSSGGGSGGSSGGGFSGGGSGGGGGGSW